ncbi:uncharacterized protein STEHIDRAFT_111401 [Stereum hirsutum FP-91666 SS1]|uniref:uncharacterized protein n=1 Tax=Stereum hirsutum (strain FP-91666) TaxID=721885 RepID=UPI000444A131|nr:uncharacterized protein STEHIDRAFT_111401 [Stereum hirsutum FP-91666 SS1]EIM85770.1 hypothetical protein STEHIDRAFT_111401 [Stereum hirsutum FP-91666 SS1]
MDVSEKNTATPSPAKVKRRANWFIPILFAIEFVLACLVLGFTVDTFQYKVKTHTWDSTTERNRICFLIFSAVRTIALAAVYIGFGFAQKYFHSMHHTIFVVLSTIFWIVSGVLIHTLFGLIECGGVGRVAGGLSECHELKIIEWLSWAIALVSVIASFPVLARAWSDWKMKKQRRANEKSGYPRHGFVV